MKILWVSNSPIGPGAELLGETYQGSSGGWIQSEYEYIDKENNSFSFLCSLTSVKKGTVLHKTGEKGELYCLHSPRLSYGITPDSTLQKNVESVIAALKPDVIHIWGTETWLSNAVSKSAPKIPKVIFLQGYISVHIRYIDGYFDRLHGDEMYQNGVSLYSKCLGVVRKHFFINQAVIEKETIQNCGNIIIDSDFAEAVNTASADYITCYRHSLKANSAFAAKHWTYDNCEKCYYIHRVRKFC